MHPDSYQKLVLYKSFTYLLTCSRTPTQYILGTGIYNTGSPLFWISGNLEGWICQGIRLKSANSQEKFPKLGKGQGMCVVREIWLWQPNKMLVTKLFSCHHITYLCFSHTIFIFNVMFLENLD